MRIYFKGIGGLSEGIIGRVSYSPTAK